MVERRRFSDSLPAELDPLTDSDWSKLSEDQRSDYLRRHAHALLERHLALLDGLNGVSMKVDAQGRRIAENAERTKSIQLRQDEHGQLLRSNTETTEASAKTLGELVTNTKAVIDLYNDAAGAGRIFGRVGSFIKDTAWIAVPLGTLAMAAKPMVELLKSWKLWPW